MNVSFFLQNLIPFFISHPFFSLPLFSVYCVCVLFWENKKVYLAIKSPTNLPHHHSKNVNAKCVLLFVNWNDFFFSVVIHFAKERLDSYTINHHQAAARLMLTMAKKNFFLSLNLKIICQHIMCCKLKHPATTNSLEMNDNSEMSSKFFLPSIYIF